jgi:SAM-dependent methyltransferase
MSEINYKFWAGYLYKLASKYCNCKKSIALELAAGKGNLSHYLYKKFDDYLLSDISISMLKKKKIKNVKTICFDMLYPSLNSQFDVIICNFDSVNYITSKIKLRKLFDNVYRLLKPNGIFLFDAGLIKNSLHHQRFALKKAEVKKMSFIRKSIFLPKSKVHKNIFKFYLPDGTIRSETHRQKIYDLNDYFLLIDKSNLFVVECLNAFTFDDCKKNNYRAQFVLKRRN